MNEFTDIQYSVYRQRLATTQKRLNICKQQIRQTINQINDLVRKIDIEELQHKVQKHVNESGIMSKIMKKRFDAAMTHVPNGSRWKPNKDGSKPLQGSGELRREAERAVQHTFYLTEKIKWSDLIEFVRLPYAEKQNEIRPFMEDPTDEELKEAFEMADRIVEKELKNILG